MADKEFEPEDPFTLTGMVLSLPPERALAAEEEMTACFIEEYLRLGWDDEALLGLFQDPFYRATHAVYRTRGEEHVRGLIARVRRGE